MKSKRHRMQRFAKWAGVVLCVLVLVAWPLSLRRHLIVCVYRTQVSLKDGMFGFVQWGDSFSEEEPWFRFFEMRKYSNSPRWQTRFWTYGNNINGEIPLFVFLIATAIPTVILWRRDRRYPQGHCQSCGYDLTGNISGICPECGTEVKG